MKLIPNCVYLSYPKTTPYANNMSNRFRLHSRQYHPCQLKYDFNLCYLIHKYLAYMFFSKKRRRVSQPRRDINTNLFTNHRRLCWTFCAKHLIESAQISYLHIQRRRKVRWCYVCCPKTDVIVMCLSSWLVITVARVYIFDKHTFILNVYIVSLCIWNWHTCCTAQITYSIV